MDGHIVAITMIGILVPPCYIFTQAKLVQFLVIWASAATMKWWHEPPLTASHIHIGYMKSVWAPSYTVDRHMDAPLHCYTGKGSPDFGNLGQRDNYEMMAWWHCWGCRPPLFASHIHIGYIKSVWAPSYAVDRHIGVPLHSYTAKVGPDFGNLG